MSGLLVFDVSRRTAYRLLLAIGFPAVFALTLWLTPAAKAVSTTPPTPPTLTDRELFTAVVDGMRTGRSYYEVYGAESRTRGYPTRSVFNWRTPLLLPAIASLTPRLGSLLFMALALALLVQAHSLLRRELLWVLTLAPAALVALVP